MTSTLLRLLRVRQRKVERAAGLVDAQRRRLEQVEDALARRDEGLAQLERQAAGAMMQFIEDVCGSAIGPSALAKAEALLQERVLVSEARIQDLAAVQAASRQLQDARRLLRHARARLSGVEKLVHAECVLVSRKRERLAEFEQEDRRATRPRRNDPMDSILSDQLQVSPVPAGGREGGVHRPLGTAFLSALRQATAGTSGDLPGDGSLQSGTGSAPGKSRHPTDRRPSPDALAVRTDAAPAFAGGDESWATLDRSTRDQSSSLDHGSIARRVDLAQVGALQRGALAAPDASPLETSPRSAGVVGPKDFGGVGASTPAGTSHGTASVALQFPDSSWAVSGLEVNVLADGALDLILNVDRGSLSEVSGQLDRLRRRLEAKGILVAGVELDPSVPLPATGGSGA